jgi:hypothetical protein
MFIIRPTQRFLRQETQTEGGNKEHNRCSPWGTGFIPCCTRLAPGEHTFDFGGMTGKFSVDVRYDAPTINE